MNGCRSRRPEADGHVLRCVLPHGPVVNPNDRPTMHSDSFDKIVGRGVIWRPDDPLAFDDFECPTCKGDGMDPDNLVSHTDCYGIPHYDDRSWIVEDDVVTVTNEQMYAAAVALAEYTPRLPFALPPAALRAALIAALKAQAGEP